MKNIPTTKSVDWRAAVRAGLLAALVSLTLYLFFVPAAVGAGNAATILRYMASLLIGVGVLAPPATLTPVIGFAALSVHIGVSLIMAAIIAFVLHRWGFITGLLGGAIFGLIFFAINYYSVTLIFPHFYAMAHWSVVLVHVVFGATAGAFYEILEFEPGETALGEEL